MFQHAAYNKTREEYHEVRYENGKFTAMFGTHVTRYVKVHDKMFYSQ